MKQFHLMLLIGLVTFFGLLIAGMYLYEPLMLKWYEWELDSDDPVERGEAVKKLLLMGDEGSKVVYRRYKKLYASDDVEERLDIVEELCRFGDRGKAVMYNIFRERCLSEMVWIPGGSFMMGSENGVYWEKPIHKVTLSGFWMDKYEVTNEKYLVFCKLSGYSFPFGIWQEMVIADNKALRPVSVISWLNAKAYTDWLKAHLPTEAQWEYACRAGSTTEYYFGDNSGELNEHAWYQDNSNDRTHKIGVKKPNKWGLYDMYGNIQEYCLDWYGEEYYKTSPTNNPRGPSTGTHRIIRGASYRAGADYNRSASRMMSMPDVSSMSNGFRACLSSSD